MRKRKTEKTLKNKEKEAFCKAYAGSFWGDPSGAAQASGWGNPEDGSTLLTNPEIVERIRELRRRKAELSVADEVWIREAFIGIVRSAEKDADRLRALAGLQKLLADQTKTSGKDEAPEQGLLPLFEGCEDGDGIL